jgi:tRNA1Val (adenine37-N6)-methyltransferase
MRVSCRNKKSLMKASRSHDVNLRPGETLDEFMNGRLRLIQSARGYRFSVDAVLLAQFVTVKPGDVLVDLGAGCGIISLVLLLEKPVAYAVAVEIQQSLADQALRNASLNGATDRMGVLLADLRQAPFRKPVADLVVCNPPFRRPGSGRVNPDLERAIARHEIMASLNDVLGAAGSVLKPKGRVALIYPASRLADLMVRMRAFELEPKKMQVVYPSMEEESKLVLVEGVRGAKAGVKILPPLMDQGDFSIVS